MSANHQSHALFIGGLLETSTSDSLINYFSQFGEIKGVNLIIDWVTGKSKRCAIVSCHDEMTFNKIIHSKPHYLEGKHVRVDVADQKKKGTKIVKTTKIFLGHIPPSVEQEDLYQFFIKYGDIKHIKIIKSHESEPSSHGYLEFLKVCDAQNLLKERHSVVVKGHKIFCQPFKAKTVQEGQFLKMISNFNSEKLEHCLKIYFQMQVGSMSKSEQREFFCSFGQFLYSDQHNFGNERPELRNANEPSFALFGSQGSNYQFQQQEQIENPVSQGWSQFQNNLQWKPPKKFKNHRANQNVINNQNQISQRMTEPIYGFGTNNYEHPTEQQMPQVQKSLRGNFNLYAPQQQDYQFPPAQGHFYSNRQNILNQNDRIFKSTDIKKQVNNNIFNLSPGFGFNNIPQSQNFTQFHGQGVNNFNGHFASSSRKPNNKTSLKENGSPKGNEHLLLFDQLSSESPTNKLKSRLLGSYTATTTTSRHSSSADGEERSSTEGFKFDSLLWFEGEQKREREDSVRSEEELYEDELLREATNVGCHSNINC